MQLQHEAAELAKVFRQEEGERKWVRASLPIPVLLHAHAHPCREVYSVCVYVCEMSLKPSNSTSGFDWEFPQGE